MAVLSQNSTRMDLFRRKAAWLRQKCHLLVEFVYQNKVEWNVFRLVYVILAVGGTYFKSTKTWHRVFWRCYMYITVGHFLIIALNFAESLIYTDDNVATVGFIRVLLIFFAGFIRDIIVRHYVPDIENADSFINTSPILSNDANHDQTVRAVLKRKIQCTCLAILTVVFICLLFVPFLLSQQAKSYQLPQILLYVGTVMATVIQVFYVMTIFPIWVNKALGPTTLIAALLAGFKTEYKIVVHGFECFVKEILKIQQYDDAFWILLKQRVCFHIQQHILWSENLMHLKHLIKNLYFVVHYYSMMMIAFSLFMLILEGTLAGRLVIVVGTGTFFVECYGWCSLAEDFQYLNKVMDDNAFDLMTAIPYQTKHHSDYMQLRSTLMTFKINIRRGAEFSCGGIFKLSMEAFVHIVNRSYFLLTFLLNVGPESKA